MSKKLYTAFKSLRPFMVLTLLLIFMSKCNEAMDMKVIEKDQIEIGQTIPNINPQIDQQNNQNNDKNNTYSIIISIKDGTYETVFKNFKPEIIIGEKFSFKGKSGRFRNSGIDIEGEIKKLEEGILSATIKYRHYKYGGWAKKNGDIVEINWQENTNFNIIDEQSKMLENKFTWEGKGHGQTITYDHQTSDRNKKETEKEWDFQYKIELKKRLMRSENDSKNLLSEDAPIKVPKKDIFANKYGLIMAVILILSILFANKIW